MCENGVVLCSVFDFVFNWSNSRYSFGDFKRNFVDRAKKMKYLRGLQWVNDVQAAEAYIR